MYYDFIAVERIKSTTNWSTAHVSNHWHLHTTLINRIWIINMMACQSVPNATECYIHFIPKILQRIPPAGKNTLLCIYVFYKNSSAITLSTSVWYIACCYYKTLVMFEWNNISWRYISFIEMVQIGETFPDVGTNLFIPYVQYYG